MPCAPVCWSHLCIQQDNFAAMYRSVDKLVKGALSASSRATTTTLARQTLAAQVIKRHYLLPVGDVCTHASYSLLAFIFTLQLLIIKCHYTRSNSLPQKREVKWRLPNGGSATRAEEDPSHHGTPFHCSLILMRESSCTWFLKCHAGNYLLTSPYTFNIFIMMIQYKNNLVDRNDSM